MNRPRVLQALSGNGGPAVMAIVAAGCSTEQTGSTADTKPPSDKVLLVGT